MWERHRSIMNDWKEKPKNIGRSPKRVAPGYRLCEVKGRPFSRTTLREMSRQYTVRWPKFPHLEGTTSRIYKALHTMSTLHHLWETREIFLPWTLRKGCYYCSNTKFIRNPPGILFILHFSCLQLSSFTNYTCLQRDMRIHFRPVVIFHLVV